MIRLACLLLLLSACTPKAEMPPSDALPVPPEPGMIPAAFTCPDSTVIYAIFRTDSAGRSEVSLAIGDERLRLSQAISADGTRYADSSVVFWNKGKEATLERGGSRKVCVTP